MNYSDQASLQVKAPLIYADGVGKVSGIVFGEAQDKLVGWLSVEFLYVPHKADIYVL